MFKPDSFGPVRSASRVTVRVKLAATFPIKIVCLAERRPCSKRRACAWNNVPPAFTRTCGSETTLLANRARTRASNAYPARTVRCATRRYSCKPDSVVRRARQGTSRHKRVGQFRFFFARNNNHCNNASTIKYIVLFNIPDTIVTWARAPSAI